MLQRPAYPLSAFLVLLITYIFVLNFLPYNNVAAGLSVSMLGMLMKCGYSCAAQEVVLVNIRYTSETCWFGAEPKLGIMYCYGWLAG